LPQALVLVSHISDPPHSMAFDMIRPVFLKSS
jgi:hypothetical protein